MLHQHWNNHRFFRLRFNFSNWKDIVSNCSGTPYNCNFRLPLFLKKKRHRDSRHDKEKTLSFGVPWFVSLRSTGVIDHCQRVTSTRGERQWCILSLQFPKTNRLSSGLESIVYCTLSIFIVSYFPTVVRPREIKNNRQKKLANT